MNKTPRIGISACLLGQCVRYDGGHKRDSLLVEEMGPQVEWVPVCPEAECGLGVPRDAMHLMGDLSTPRLLTRETRIDHTERMRTWTAKRLDELEKEGLDGFILKARSPSCGLAVKVFSVAGSEIGESPGLFARALMERFPGLPASEDELLHDPRARDEFLTAARRRARKPQTSR